MTAQKAPAAKKPGGKPKAAKKPLIDEVPSVGEGANIYQRMAAVMNEAGTIPKNKHNDFHNYDYAGEDDIINTLRPLLVKHGLTTTVTVANVEYLRIEGDTRSKDQEVRRVEMVFTIVNIDKPEEFIYSTFTGEGWDKGDKGLYKAYTGCLKYWLLKTFMVATGDDPERDETVAAKQEAATHQGGGGVPASTPREPGLASQSQLNHYFKLSDDLNFEEKNFASVKKHYGVEHTNELTMEQASEIIGHLKQMVKDAEKGAGREDGVRKPELAPELDTPPPDLAEYGDEINDALADEIKSKEDEVTEKVNKLFGE